MNGAELMDDVLVEADDSTAGERLQHLMAEK